MSSRTAFSLYSALSIVLTWPLVLGIGRDVPGDLGDSLLNMWILAWGAEHLPRLLTGAMSWSDFWNANIYHPEPLSLAMSEHLFGEVLQILPIYWLTGNIILCYNLLFISTFALSAFGTYLLVRDLTGDRRAAFIAGLIYGFLPYRIPSIPHVQVLSSQWMPFALWGFNRFLTDSTHSTRWLVAATAALVMQNWSNGYYLLYFAPFVPLFIVHRMWTLGTLGTVRTVRIWCLLVLAAAGTLALSLPFLLPYQRTHSRDGIERVFNEVEQFGANVWSYVTASEQLTFLGDVVDLYRFPEGETFLGFTAMLLAVAGIAIAIAKTASNSPAPWSRVPSAIAWVILVAATSQFIALGALVLFGGFEIDVLGVSIRARTPERLLIQLGVATALLFAISPKARGVLARFLREPIALFTIFMILAVWLSLGVAPKSGNTLLSNFGIYNFLFDWVPGFSGLRAPSRYAMLAGLFLAITAGYGMRELLDPPKPALLSNGRRRTAIVALLVLLESAAVPLLMNHSWSQFEARPPARVYPAAQAPPVYARIAALPDGSAITEFPFGDPAWELRYVYYSTAHWRPITNGYSGGFPHGYRQRIGRFRRVTVEPDAAFQALLDSKTTHVVFHSQAFGKSADAEAVLAWLQSHGATELERFPDGDILFVLK